MCDNFSAENFVIPKILQSGNNIIATVDNIDHNATSNTEVNHFHGTIIAMFQHAEDHTELNEIHILDTNSKYK